MLTLTAPTVNATNTTLLRQMKGFKAKTDGTFGASIVAAAYAAKKYQRVCYLYLGNSYMSKVWIPTLKMSDVVSSINNIGSVVHAVMPDLTAMTYQIVGR